MTSTVADATASGAPTPDVDARLAIAAGWRDAPDAHSVQQIQNLVACYALLADAGRAAELTELFTADATWDGRDQNYGVYEGPDAIGAGVAGHYRPEEPTMHVPGPALLTLVGDDEVHAVCWCLATRWTDGQTRPHTHFYYEDVIRRGSDDVWRFHHRRLRPAFPPRH